MINKRTFLWVARMNAEYSANKLGRKLNQAHNSLNKFNHALGGCQ